MRNTVWKMNQATKRRRGHLTEGQQYPEPAREAGLRDQGDADGDDAANIGTPSSGFGKPKISLCGDEHHRRAVDGRAERARQLGVGVLPQGDPVDDQRERGEEPKTTRDDQQPREPAVRAGQRPLLDGFAPDQTGAADSEPASSTAASSSGASCAGALRRRRATPGRRGRRLAWSRCVVAAPWPSRGRWLEEPGKSGTHRRPVDGIRPSLTCTSEQPSGSRNARSRAGEAAALPWPPHSEVRKSPGPDTAAEGYAP